MACIICWRGEIIGLRWDDIDFKGNVISINHNLVYRIQDNGECEFHITTPKTKNSVRIVPLLSEVRKALLTEKKLQFELGKCNCVEIDGYTNFVFQNRFGNVHNPMTINRAIKRIYTAYNKGNYSEPISKILRISSMWRIRPIDIHRNILFECKHSSHISASICLALNSYQ